MRMDSRYRIAVGLALALAVASCSDPNSGSSRLAGPQGIEQQQEGVVYQQIEQLGNPGLQEVTTPKALHDRYDRTQPSSASDRAFFMEVTRNFILTVAGRPAEVANTLVSVLYPDVLVVQLDKAPGTAGWLTWVPALGNGYGGRKLTDDIVDIALVAIFGPLLSPLHVSPGLASDNVNHNDKAFLPTFPYLATPH